ncbi:MAG: ABC transporter permease subunit [Oscillospiraceae bacterium]|nr:ABC transporter permease subunit [Oscillospiraceae bacterium]
MIRYVLKRLLTLIPVIIAVSFIVFALMELAPGTIIDAMITDGMTPDDIQTLIREFNLDRSMFYRYGLYMLNLLQGDLGVSDATRISVWSTFITRLPNTLILSFTALIFGILFAVPMGIFAARRAGTLLDNVATGVTLVGMSMPIFWIGLLLLLLFSFHLGWLPAGGFDHGIRSLILPAICSGLSLTASTTRQTRAGMLEVLKSDYLRTARAKGVPEKTVIRRHALANAWIPIVTAAGVSLSMQLAGSVVVEQVFAWPGIGRMAFDAVFARDVTSTTGVVILTTILYVLVQLIVDILYAFIDPRIKAQYLATGKKKKTSHATDVRSSAHAAPRIVVHLTDEERNEMLAAQSASEAESAAIIDTVSEESVSFATRVLDIKERADEDSVSKGDEILATRKYRKRSQMGDIFYRVRKNKGAMTGLVIVGFLFLLVIVSLFMSFDMVTARNVQIRLEPPNWPYLFGTDGMGRNALLRVVFGTRYTLAIGFGASLIGAFFGVSIGAISGYFGGKVDDIIMRCSDVLASIPGMLLGMVIVTVLGQSLQNLIIAVGVSGIPIYIRITRASVLQLSNSEYIEAARAVGLSNLRIIFAQALPNGLSPIIVAFSVNFGMTIIVASSLSFIGFGVPMPHPEWGSMIAMGREFMRSAPWLVTFPGVFIMLTVLAFNLLGDGLRDALDPKLKR